MTLDPNRCYQALLTRDARFDGVFFVGVRSTGIYCRPVCRAQAPRREHRTFHPSAAAAFPHTDLAFRKAQREPDPRRVPALAEAWSPLARLRGDALWKSLEETS